MKTPPFAVLRDQDPATSRRRWLVFERPRQVLSCDATHEIKGLLARVQKAWDAGAWVVGCLSYEAAAAFDEALCTHPPGPQPLAWWALCDPPQVHQSLPWGSQVGRGDVLETLDWQPGLDWPAYRQALRRIHRHIAAGDTYQVNYTFQLEAPLSASPRRLFDYLHRAQPEALHSAYLDFGRFAACSVSPELFFALDGDRLTTRPMKGTAPRGRFPAEDAERLDALAQSAKDRAENVMIVDMMRNDLGKIARPGSVRVPQLFTVETHPTVHQLTSTIVAESDADLPSLMGALFPCASITGAPKVRTMEIIRGLEPSPRGIYTGTLGFLAPAAGKSPRRARFSVAIRTAVVDRQRQRVTFGTGGGIVWDSVPRHEFEECRTKSRVLTTRRPEFELLETLGWYPSTGYRRFEDHLQRLIASAHYFGVPVDAEDLRSRLLDLPPEPGRPPESTAALSPRRVRWLLNRNGRLDIHSAQFERTSKQPWQVVLDDRPVDSTDPFLFHKTTHRAVYEAARRRHPAADEVLLWNERRQLTEGLRSNVLLKLDGRWVTPSISCGLLGGIFRQRLLGRRRIEECILSLDALYQSETILLVNSLRGFVKAQFNSSIRPAGS